MASYKHKHICCQHPVAHTQCPQHLGSVLHKDRRSTPESPGYQDGVTYSRGGPSTTMAPNELNVSVAAPLKGGGSGQKAGGTQPGPLGFAMEVWGQARAPREAAQKHLGFHTVENPAPQSVVPRIIDGYRC